MFHKDEIPFSIGLAAGAIVLGFIGFNALGWKTAGKAESMASQHANNAMVSAYAQICMTRFNDGKDAPARMAKLQAADRWSRGDVLTKGGWATMPGAKEAGSGVAQACADLLVPEKG
jgi:hypothetical protein